MWDIKLIKKIKSSLFAKVFIITALLLAGVSFLVYGVLAWFMPKTYSNESNGVLGEQTRAFIDKLSQISMEDSANLFDRFLENPNIDHMELLGNNGQQVDLPTEKETLASVDDAVYETPGDPWDSGPDNIPVISGSYSFSFFGDNTEYTLVVYGAAGQVAELRRSFIRILPFLAFTVIIVSLISSWIFSRLITNPVLKISRISKEMSELKLDWQLDERRTDELGTLETSLNYLSRQLGATLKDLQDANKKLEADIEHEKALEQAQLDFFSAASHELKTPITVIKGQLEGMLLGIGAYKDHKKYLSRSLEIANTLETMVQELLTVSRLQTPNADYKSDYFDCVPIIQSYLKETEDLIVTRELQINLDLPDAVFVNGNKFLIEKVFSNLIGNAIKYSPQGANIDISVHMEQAKYLFCIENSGTHIPEEAAAKIFDAFYRVDRSRSRKTGGSGLGLYIVQKILQQHNSYCSVCNTKTGVRFSFELS